jgi:cytochrome c5
MRYPVVIKPLLKKAAILLGALGLGAALSVSTHAVTENQRKAIEERIAPVGKVCLEGDSSCGAAVAAAAGGGSRSGEDVYNTTCMACHGTGAAGAPKTGVADDWAPRIAKGLDVLHKHALEGFNAMPPKGLCMDCSEEEVIAATDFMVEQSK